MQRGSLTPSGPALVCQRAGVLAATELLDRATLRVLVPVLAAEFEREAELWGNKLWASCVSGSLRLLVGVLRRKLPETGAHERVPFGDTNVNVLGVKLAISHRAYGPSVHISAGFREMGLAHT